MNDQGDNGLARWWAQSASTWRRTVLHFATGNLNGSRAILAGNRWGSRSMTDQGNAAPRDILVMTPAYDKLCDVALLLISMAARQGYTITHYYLVNAAFLADCEHLKKHGRPITFDVYKAMPHGPVPSAFYDMLMEDPAVLARTGAAQWTRTPRPDMGPGAIAFGNPKRLPDLEWMLSPSEVRELEAAFKIVIRLDFVELRRMNREHPAYKEARQRGGNKESAIVDYGLLLDIPDDALVRSLADRSSWKGNP